jgi:ribonuclease HI
LKSSLEIYIDGASRGNPGRSGAGIVIKETNGSIHKIKKNLGILTNNQAEYEALINALKAAKGLKKNHLKIYSDSLLLVNQMNGSWRIRNPDILALSKKARSLIKGFEEVEIIHIPRESNREADKLANAAIDEYP